MIYYIRSHMMLHAFQQFAQFHGNLYMDRQYTCADILVVVSHTGVPHYLFFLDLISLRLVKQTVYGTTMIQQIVSLEVCSYICQLKYMLLTCQTKWLMYIVYIIWINQTYEMNNSTSICQLIGHVHFRISTKRQ
jgi:hypothetical protein